MIISFQASLAGQLLCDVHCLLANCVACGVRNVVHPYCVRPRTLCCASAGLRNLQDLNICGAVAFAEEKPGILNRMLEGIISLHLTGLDMCYSDIESTSLRYLTALLHTSRLPGADSFSRQPLSSTQVQPSEMTTLRLHAVGNCPQLQALEHSAYEATAAHLCRYTQVQSLSELLDQQRPDSCFFSVAELTPLTYLQHLRLTQCALLGYLT